MNFPFPTPRRLLALTTLAATCTLTGCATTGGADAAESLRAAETAFARSMGPDGKQIAHFASTWRRTATGRWEVVFDNGYPVCDCKK